MVIKDILKSPTKIRAYFVGLTIFFVALVILNYYLLPEIFLRFDLIYEGAAVSFLNNIIALLASSIVASGFIWLVTPSGLGSGDINIIAPYDLKSTLRTMIDATERFSYVGHTARWNRAVTLPRLYEVANESKSTKHIELVIIDPDNDKVCELYSSFGHGERRKGRAISEIRDVKIELFTTFLTCLKFNKSPFLDIKLYVSSQVSLFRLDIADDAIVMTKPNTGDPALHFPKGTFFYSSYKEDFNVTKLQCREISLNISQENIDQSNCLQLLNDAGFDCSVIDEQVIKELVEALNKVSIPY